MYNILEYDNDLFWSSIVLSFVITGRVGKVRGAFLLFNRILKNKMNSIKKSGTSKST